MELAARMPSSIKLRGTDKKYVLKRLLQPQLGKGFLNRRKQGFTVPVGDWFRGELGNVFRDSVLSKDSFVSTYLDLEVVSTVLANHQACRRDEGDALWSLLFLEQWAAAQLRSSPAFSTP